MIDITTIILLGTAYFSYMHDRNTQIEADNIYLLGQIIDEDDLERMKKKDNEKE